LSASPQTPLGGAYSALPDLLAGLRGPTFNGGEWRGGKGVEGREGKECAPLDLNPGDATDLQAYLLGLLVISHHRYRNVLPDEGLYTAGQIYYICAGCIMYSSRQQSK